MYIAAFANGFYTVQTAVLYDAVRRVPYGGARFFVHGAVFHIELFNVPERISQREAAILNSYVACFLQHRVAVGGTGKNAVLNIGVAKVVERALFIECFVLNSVSHSLSFCCFAVRLRRFAPKAVISACDL